METRLPVKTLQRYATPGDDLIICSRFLPDAKVPEPAFDWRIQHRAFGIHHQRNDRCITNPIYVFNRCVDSFNYHKSPAMRIQNPLLWLWFGHRAL